MAHIAVLGSANIDYVVEVAHLPRAGETVHGRDLVTTFGGKGANAAVAAARLGGNVELIGCVGDDAPGSDYIRHLENENVGTTNLRRAGGRPTGSAMILVDSGAENIIAVAPGANSAITLADVRGAAEVIRTASVLLMQFEVPLDCVVEAAKIANAAGVPVILNPSPLHPEFEWSAARFDYLVVNEGEAETLGATSAGDLQQRGFQTVIITRGADTTVFANTDSAGEVPAFPVTPVDTVGAGDTFAGALAVAFSEGRPLADAIRFANAAAALATTRTGPQTSMPKRSAVEQLLRPA